MSTVEHQAAAASISPSNCLKRSFCHIQERPVRAQEVLNPIHCRAAGWRGPTSNASAARGVSYPSARPARTPYNPQSPKPPEPLAFGSPASENPLFSWVHGRRPKTRPPAEQNSMAFNSTGSPLLASLASESKTHGLLFSRVFYSTSARAALWSRRSLGDVLLCSGGLKRRDFDSTGHH